VPMCTWQGCAFHMPRTTSVVSIVGALSILACVACSNDDEPAAIANPTLSASATQTSPRATANVKPTPSAPLVPTATPNRSRYLSSHSHDAELDITLAAINQHNIDVLMSRVAFVPEPCSIAPDGPDCRGVPQGTVIPSFLLRTRDYDGYLSDDGTLRTILARIKGRHAAWTIHAVRRTTATDVRRTAYAVLLRAATGNSGTLWFLNEDWLAVGVADGDPSYFALEPLEGVEYLCGPGFSPDCYH
jgi:hypothetical protein